MRAIEIHNNSLRLTESPPPSPKAGEVLIKIAYAGLNRADILQRKGLYPPPPGASPLPGMEVSGEIVALGPDAHSPTHHLTPLSQEESLYVLKVGDNVCALLEGGGYAEYCTAPAGQVLPIPKGMDVKTAAGIPEAFFTVWLSLMIEGGLENSLGCGDYKRSARTAAEFTDGVNEQRKRSAPLIGAQPSRILIHGGASGIGTTAIQLMRALGAEVYTTAGTDEKCAACRKLGAIDAVNYKTQDFATEIKKATNGYGVDVILDITAGDNVQKNIDLLAQGGRMVIIALMRGRKAEVDFAPLLLKRLKIIGSTLRSRSQEQKTVISQALYTHVWPLLEKGIIFPVIDSEFALADADKAHVRMETGLHIGKILLKM